MAAKKDICKLHCCTVTEARGEEIRASVSERPRPNYGPACVCGLREGVTCGRHPVVASGEDS